MIKLLDIVVCALNIGFLAFMAIFHELSGNFPAACGYFLALMWSVFFYFRPALEKIERAIWSRR